MADEYYILTDGQKEGPYTFYEITTMELDIDTRLLSPGTDKWQEACEIPEFNQYFESKGFYFPTQDNLATFWWRLLAYALDSVFLSIAFIVILYIMMANGKDIDIRADGNRILFNVIVFCIVVVYHSICEATEMRGSLGKKCCNLYVVDANGMRLTYSKALVRNFGRIISSLPFGMGYVNIFFNEHHQAWHDQIAKTYVIKRS